MTEYEFHIEYANTKSELDIGSINQLKFIINTCAKDILLRLFQWFDASDSGFKLPIIVFDNSCPTDEQCDGDLSVFDVRDALISLLSESPDLDSSLREIISQLEQFKKEDELSEAILDLRDSITDMLFLSDATPAEKEFSKRAGGIITRCKTEEPVLTSVLGRFYPKTNIIFLYYNNWGYDYDLKNIRVILAKTILTLSHEMFHAFHYFLAGKQFLKTGSHPEIVKEASADFFSLFYCLLFYSDSLRFSPNSRFDEVKDEVFHRYFEWKECFLAKWPASKALYYLRLKDKEPIDAEFFLPVDYNGFVTYGSIDKLREIVLLSQSNMENAYHTLIHEENDYIIPYAERAGRIFLNTRINIGPELSTDKKIVEFSIIHHVGTSWGGKAKPPIRYTIKMSDCSIDEIHYKSDGINPPVDSRITIKADSKLTEGFFKIVNDLDWSKDYIVPAFNGGSWNVTLTYSNQSRKSISGTSTYSPNGAAQLTSLIKKMYAVAGYTARPYIF